MKTALTFRTYHFPCPQQNLSVREKEPVYRYSPFGLWRGHEEFCRVIFESGSSTTWTRNNIASVGIEHWRCATQALRLYVKSLSRLTADRDKYNGKRYVCLSCLQVFFSQKVLNNHAQCCLMHAPQRVTYPDPDDPLKCKLSFRFHFKEFPYSFYLWPTWNVSWRP